MECEQAQELITALVDNELAKEERETVEAHLWVCQNCRSAHEQELNLKRQIRRLSAAVTAPVDLRETVQAEIERLRANLTPVSPTGWRSWLKMPVLRPALALIVLALVVIPVTYQLWPTKGVAVVALEMHENIIRGEKPFTRSKDPVQLKRQLVQAVGNRFAPMGYDLSGMKVYPVGGFVEEILGRQVLVTVYQGDGPAVTCFTFLGTEADAPQGARLIHDAVKRMNFYTFADGGTHAVLHREGEAICIMVSRMPMADLLAMVREKARPA